MKKQDACIGRALAKEMAETWLDNILSEGSRRKTKFEFNKRRRHGWFSTKKFWEGYREFTAAYDYLWGSDLDRVSTEHFSRPGAVDECSKKCTGYHESELSPNAGVF